jgi:arsenate reductase (thioredoxin)
VKTYLFVCVHNSGRSQMAEAFVNHYASAHGLAVKGLSAGTVGGFELNPRAVEAMAEIGISMTGHTPKILKPEMLDSDTQVISMGCGVDAEACPTKFLISQDWGLDDPAGMPIETVRRIRDEIEARVRQLLQVV